ncbi:MAG: hypothetical protein JNJ60_03670 [Rhodocyclaceae bacterium]|nr:hypothetical protein [Rhodocyclaceae bacterium]
MPASLLAGTWRTRDSRDYFGRRRQAAIECLERAALPAHQNCLAPI